MRSARDAGSSLWWILMAGCLATACGMFEFADDDDDDEEDYSDYPKLTMVTVDRDAIVAHHSVHVEAHGNNFDDGSLTVVFVRLLNNQEWASSEIVADRMSDTAFEALLGVSGDEGAAYYPSFHFNGPLSAGFEAGYPGASTYSANYGDDAVETGVTIPTVTISMGSGIEIAAGGSSLEGRVAEGAFNQYYFAAASGTSYTVNLYVVGGDPDLFVCRTPPCDDNSSDSLGAAPSTYGDESFIFTADQTTDYQIGVKGQGGIAEYSLLVVNNG